MSAQNLEENNQIPTAVVAGGAGFIGATLCERLLNHHIEVVCVDNLSSGKKQNLKSLKKHPNFHFLKLDVTSASLKRVTRAHYVFHLIDTEEHADSSNTNLDTLLAGTKATKQLLDLAAKFKAKFLLASTINVYQAFLSTDSLNEYFGPTTQQENFYSFSEAKRIAEAITAETYKTKNLNSRIVRLIDVYGPRMDLEGNSPIPSLLKAVKTGQPLRVKGDGLRPLYPTYIFDVVEGLMKAMFTVGASGKIYTLAYPQSISEMNFAYKLRELTPHRQQIEFTDEKTEEKKLEGDIQKSQFDINWYPRVSLEEGLGQTLQWLETISVKKKPLTLDPTPSPQTDKHLPKLKKLIPTPPSNLKKITPKKRFLRKIRLTQPKTKTSVSKVSFSQALPKRSKPTFKKALLFSFLGLLLLVTTPFITLAVTSLVGANSLKSTQQALLSGEINSAKNHAQTSRTFFTTSQQNLRLLSPAVSALGLENYLFRLEKVIGLGVNLSQASIHLTEATSHLIVAGQVVIGSDTGDSISSINSSQSEITRAYELLSLSTAELQDDRPNLEKIKIGALDSFYSQLRRDVPRLTKSTERARSLLSILPQMIGADNFKKTYLILLQNNAELRPTGGFIGSFALVSFQNGKLLDFIVEDVYTADGQLIGHVDPPAPIRQHLGEASWYLRDVNWDPDFPTTARQAEWFLQKEIKKQVDGTIAINLYVTQNLLSALGEITLPDYNETISSTNLFDRAEFHSEVDFFPGSTQKKDFLSALSQAIFLRLKDLTDQEALSVAQAVEQSLSEDQLFISLTDPDISSKFKSLSWDGSFKDQSACKKETQCYPDYLALREANLGVNKANFFVKRKLDYNIQIFKEDHLAATTTILYTNDSPAESWPGGKYKNFLRLYTPRGSELKSVTIDGKKVDEEIIDAYDEHGKTVFAFLVTVPVKSQSSVVVKYDLPGEMVFGSTGVKSRYSLFVQKQSGTGSDPLTIKFIHPAYMKPALATPEAVEIQPQNILLTSDLLTNRELIIDLTK